MPSRATLAFGEEVMRTLLGVDVLYRAESGDDDGIAVLNMDSGGLYTPEELGDYAATRARLLDLEERAAGLPEPDRRTYYRQLAQSTLAFVEWRVSGLPFVRQLAEFLHVPAAPAADGELDSLKHRMRALLGRMGYHGDLRAQCHAWEERNRVDPADVPEVLSDLLDQAWTRTEERVVGIPADRSDGMRVAGVSGVAYNARCDYLRRTIDLNVDPTLTRPALKHLAVHEGYPGHYLQFKLRETMAAQGQAPADVLLSVVNSASSSVFEGIADTGLRMLGWLESDDDRVASIMNRYRAGIGTVAAWRLHAEGATGAEVADDLRERSLVGGEGWVQNRMAFIAAPARAVLIWSYWWGERVVAPVWDVTAPEDRADFVHFLYGRMHSNSTVEMFR